MYFCQNHFVIFVLQLWLIEMSKTILILILIFIDTDILSETHSTKL